MKKMMMNAAAMALMAVEMMKERPAPRHEVSMMAAPKTSMPRKQWKKRKRKIQLAKASRRANR
jgi:hypothetical protein